MSTNHSEFSEIPKVNLVNFSFSPPGPMGWSSAEYETMLEDPEAFLSQHKARHAEPAYGNVELIELPIKRRKPKDENLSVQSFNEMAQENVQIPVQKGQEAAEEPAVKNSKQVIEQQIASEAVAEMPKTEVQEPAAKAEEVLPAASYEAGVTQELSASEQPINESVMFPGSRSNQGYSYDKLIDLFNGINSDSNQSNKNQAQKEFRFTSSGKKSKSGPSSRKNRVIFID